ILDGTDATNNGILQFFQAGVTGNIKANQTQMQWFGFIYMPTVLSAGLDRSGAIIIDNVHDTTNFERFVFQASGFPGDLQIGTTIGGTGVARDVQFVAGGSERLRLIAGDRVKFTASQNFAANGSVATVLGSVGPAGSSTTVQKWLTFKDD